MKPNLDTDCEPDADSDNHGTFGATLDSGAVSP